MDEYTGLDLKDTRRFRTFLEQSLVTPLGMTAEFLTGEESTAQMQEKERRLGEEGGLHLVLHGIGRNGHLAFNEPGTSFDAGGRRVVLAAQTRAAGIFAFGAHTPTHGVTFGLRLLNQATQVRVVATGHYKRRALRRGLWGVPSVDSPLSSLQGHPDCKIFADREAYPATLRPGDAP